MKKLRLGGFIRSELDELIQECNFTEEQGIIFDMLAKGKSIKEISFKTHISESTVNRRISELKKKVGKYYDGKNNTERKRS